MNETSSWVTRTLADIFTVSSGTGLSKEKMSNGEIPVYGGNGITGYHDSYIYEHEMLIIGRVGEHCGNVYITSPYSWITDNALVVTFKRKDEYLKFWYYYLKYLKLNQYAYSSAQPVITGGILKSIKSYVPENSKKQRKIAKILTTIDQLIDKTQALIDKHTVIKQGMMADLFTQGIDLTTGQLRPPVEQAPHLYKETELGWVPKDWDIKSISDLSVRVGSGITPTGGSEIYESEGVMFLRSQNITFDGLKLEDVAYIDEKTHQSMTSSEVFAYDVLINITGASIGRCCYLTDGFGSVNTNQHVCAIRLADSREENAIYLSRILSSYIGQNQIFRLNAGGNREGLNYQQLRSFLIPWPKQNKEIDLIISRLISIEEKITKYGSEKQKNISLKHGLMQDLLTGNISVVMGGAC